MAMQISIASAKVAARIIISGFHGYSVYFPATTSSTTAPICRGTTAPITLANRYMQKVKAALPLWWIIYAPIMRATASGGSVGSLATVHLLFLGFVGGA